MYLYAKSGSPPWFRHPGNRDLRVASRLRPSMGLASQLVRAATIRGHSQGNIEFFLNQMCHANDTPQQKHFLPTKHARDTCFFTTQSLKAPSNN